jgi:hypothetical protein
MQRASEWLLEHGTPVGIRSHQTTTTTPAASTTIDLTDDEDDEIQKVIQASLVEEKKPSIKPNLTQTI